MDALFADSLGRLLGAHCNPAVVREAERTQRADALWAEIEASGFLDALVDESAGGAGLGQRGAFDLWLLCGRHAVPLPLAPTMPSSSPRLTVRSRPWRATTSRLATL